MKMVVIVLTVSVLLSLLGEIALIEVVNFINMQNVLDEVFVIVEQVNVNVLKDILVKVANVLLALTIVQDTVLVNLLKIFILLKTLVHIMMLKFILTQKLQWPMVMNQLLSPQLVCGIAKKQWDANVTLYGLMLTVLEECALKELIFYMNVQTLEIL